MLKRVPVTVGSDGRVYTSERQRSKLDLNDAQYGRGTECEVGIIVSDKTPEWGTHGQIATFGTQLGYYGEVRIPAPVRRELGLVKGDDCLITVISSDGSA